jgi:hypothetical protein
MWPCIHPNDVLFVYSPDARSRSNHPYLQKRVKATNRLLSVLFSEVLMPGMPTSFLTFLFILSAFKRSLKQFVLLTFRKISAVRVLFLVFMRTRLYNYIRSGIFGVRLSFE